MKRTLIARKKAGPNPNGQQERHDRHGRRSGGYSSCFSTLRGVLLSLPLSLHAHLWKLGSRPFPGIDADTLLYRRG